MKVTTFVIIVIIIGAALGMLFTSNHYRNEQLTKDEQEVKGKNVLQIIIDSTKNKDPFFNSSLKGKVVVVNVWNPGFPPCRKQIPELNKLVKDFASDKIVFAAFAAGDSAKEVAEMKKQDIKFDYQLFFGNRNLLKIFYELNLVHFTNEPPFPINMVINTEGRIEFIYMGNHAEQLENIRNYLAAASDKM